MKSRLFILLAAAVSLVVAVVPRSTRLAGARVGSFSDVPESHNKEHQELFSFISAEIAAFHGEQCLGKHPPLSYRLEEWLCGTVKYCEAHDLSAASDHFYGRPQFRTARDCYRAHKSGPKTRPISHVAHRLIRNLQKAFHPHVEVGNLSSKIARPGLIHYD